jgi:hypothetical protein
MQQPSFFVGGPKFGTKKSGDPKFILKNIEGPKIFNSINSDFDIKT